ncbi:unnamed protein product, partial [Didymodactylos carnosus]
VPTTTIFWSFDNNTNDLYGVYNGQTINGPSYVSPGYVGYGSAIVLNGSLSQSVTVFTPYLNFAFRSLTIEAWIYPLVLSGDNDLFGQCQCNTCTDKCLFFILRNSCLYMGFYSDNLQGNTALRTYSWWHVAFVYDYSSAQQTVYINGIQDGTRSGGPYLGTTGNITIGTSNIQSPYNFFQGYIDQFSVTNRAKSALEILDDATLVAHYSFDSGSLLDQGPNGINGTGFGITTVTGRVNESLAFSLAGTAYFQGSGFTALAAANQSYSFSLWINPSSFNSTIVHLSSLSWSLSLMVLMANGQLVGQSWNGSLVRVTGPVLLSNIWTHVAETYSSTNGLRLYINGTIYNSTGSFYYAASTLPNYVTLANYNNGSNSTTFGPFQGTLDEFYIYSRELNSSDISVLANP